MGKPFSDLEKRALAILANGGDPAQSRDLELARYWEWRINPSANSHDLPAASTRTQGRKLDDYAIKPFGIDLPTGTFAKVTMSKRTEAALNDSQKTILQLIEIQDDTVAYRLARFTPAKVYWRTGAGTTPVERTSRITGRKYKTYYESTDQGYTAPFGKTTDGVSLQQRQQAIRGALQPEAGTVDLVSFSPEKSRN